MVLDLSWKLPLACVAARAPGQTRDTTVVLRRSPGAALPLPADFIGLGYEKSSAAQAGLLRVSNGRYLQLVRQLGRTGVLRVGGIVADFSHYHADGESRSEAKDTVVTRADLEGFAAFLKATGWTAIWSLNLARDSMANAVSEARAVASIFGDRLQAFELGNEVENYSRGPAPLRPPPYAFETFHAEYLQWRAAILQAVPDASFAAPDTAGSVEWVERMAAASRGDVQLLTTHYYRGGQKQGTFDQLLQPDARLQMELDRLRVASQASGIPWRMCETSSFYGGGRPGISDTLTGALWTLDYMLLLLANGCAGVNVETGYNQLGFVSSYSPIQDDGHGRNTAAAPYYGMLAFAHAVDGCSRVYPLQAIDPGGNVSMYALGDATGVKTAVVVNRDRLTTVHVDLGGLKLKNAMAQRLSGPAFDSTTGVTFAGAAANAQGAWTASAGERVRGVMVTVPAVSAAVVRW